MVWAIALPNVSPESTAGLEDFRERLGIDIPILLDEDRSTYDTFFPDVGDTPSFPREILIDGDGTVVWYNEAFDYDELVTVIDGVIE